MNVTQSNRHGNGLCIACGNKLGRGKWKCDSCMDKENAQKRHHKDMLKELGLCSVCGKYHVYEYEKVCPECRAKNAKWTREFCEKNRELHNARSNDARKKMRATDNYRYEHSVS